MRKQFTASHAFTCRYIDVAPLVDLAEQASVLAMATGRLASAGSMENCEIGLLCEVQENLSNQIIDGLKEIMGESDGA